MLNFFAINQIRPIPSEASDALSRNTPTGKHGQLRINLQPILPHFVLPLINHQRIYFKKST